MAEIVFILVFAFPAVLGMAELIHTAKLWLVSSRHNPKRVMIVVPDNNNFEKQIMGVYEDFKWQGSKYAQRIVVMDNLLNGENKKECAALAAKLGFEICSVVELEDLVKREAE